MLDVFDLPNNVQNTWTFYGSNTIGGGPGTWRVWDKPRGISLIHIFCIGGGGGGGGGLTGASLSARGGGGGGASSAITRATFMAALLPDRLLINVGVGGAGGNAGAAGGNGGLSTVNLWFPYISGSPGSQILIQSTSTSAGGGAAGTASGGAGGTAPPAMVAANAVFAQLGTWTSVAGQVGRAGGTNGAGASVTPLSSIILTAGAGGGGVNVSNNTFNGGDIFLAGPVPTIPGGPAGGSAGGDGIWLHKPFVGIGGAGGGSTGASGTGGKGGNGGPGSGGGGGGGGITGGAGGRGGDGLVIITCV